MQASLLNTNFVYQKLETSLHGLCDLTFHVETRFG